MFLPVRGEYAKPQPAHQFGDTGRLIQRKIPLFQLSVISYQLSVTSYQLSVTSIFARCLKGAIVVVFVFKLHIPLSRKYLSNHGFEGIGIETGFHIGVLEWITQGN